MATKSENSKTGRANRKRGMRCEYLVRDYFRSLGYSADRVPSSGASQGFKGDVRVIDNKTGESFLVEVKSRQNSFNYIYQLPLLHFGNAYYVEGAGAVAYSTEFTLIKEPEAYYRLSPILNPKPYIRLLDLKKHLKGCDYLVIKDKNKPLIFIKYDEVNTCR